MFHDWRHDYKYLTELVMVLKHKAWNHKDLAGFLISDIYITLYEVADNYAIDTLKGYELKYFFECTE